MPELPEVETTMRGIQPYVEQAVLTRVEVRNPSLRWPVPVEEIKSFIGLEITSCIRRAKYILLQASKGSLMIHLGMSGSLRVLKDNEQHSLKKHDHIDLYFAKGQGENSQWLIRYHDPRRFGSLLITDKNQQHPLLANLGPEPLSDDFNGDYLFKSSRKKTLAVKNFIMDAGIVVGVGNIYASEALFLAKVRPTRKTGKVTKAEFVRLSETIKMVLSRAIEVGGTTLRDFTSSDGQAGYFSQKLNVYDRNDQPCKCCGTDIKRIVIGQRSSFYCPVCQT